MYNFYTGALPLDSLALTGALLDVTPSSVVISMTSDHSCQGETTKVPSGSVPV